MGLKKYLIAAVGFLAVAIAVVWTNQRLNRLESERDRWKNNSEALLERVEFYQIADSLNGARVSSLELTIKEFERLRSEDAELIRMLKARNRDLAEVSKTQAETIIELSSIPRDTVIIRDSVPMRAVSVTCGDLWFDFYGLLTEDEFTGRLVNRDSLLLAETVRYKRFLGFLWKTGKIRDRHLDVISRNPHTTILGVEHTIIKK